MSDAVPLTITSLKNAIDSLAKGEKITPFSQVDVSTELGSLALTINHLAERFQEYTVYKEILSHTTDMIAQYTLEGIYTYVSPSSVHLFGYAPDELIGTNAYDLFHPEDLARIQSAHQAVLKTNEIVVVEYRLRKKDGSYVWVEVKGLTVADEQTKLPKAIVCITRDISARKKLQAEVSELSERFREAFEHSPIGIALVSLKGEWLKVNKAITTMLGYSEEELLAKTFQDITYDDDLPQDLEYADQLLSDKISNYRMEKRYIHKDGHLVWVLLSGSIVRTEQNEPKYFIAQVVDITDQKKKVHDLEKREQELSRFKHAVDASFNHIIITDAEGIILFANKAAEITTGYPSNEMRGHTPSLWGKQMPPEFYAEMWHQIKIEKRPFHGEIRNRRKNGKIYTAIATISPILDDFNEVIGFIGIEEDITEIRELEQMKANFMSTAAHQLKTPLGAMSWNLELLTDHDQAEFSPETKELLETTKKLTIT